MTNKTNTFGINVDKSGAQNRAMTEKTVGYARSYFNKTNSRISSLNKKRK